MIKINDGAAVRAGFNPAPTANAWRFRLTFAGNLPPHTYLSPDIRRRDPGWASAEIKNAIEKMEFYLPSGHKILMSGMAAYCFFVEASQALSGRGKTRIEAFWFCGRLPQTKIVEMWRVGSGKVIRQRKPFGSEWGGTAIAGWKPGSVGSAPFSVLMHPEA
jgi:hypothetical protein